MRGFEVKSKLSAFDLQYQYITFTVAKHIDVLFTLACWCITRYNQVTQIRINTVCFDYVYLFTITGKYDCWVVAYVDLFEQLIEHYYFR